MKLLYNLIDRFGLFFLFVFLEFISLALVVRSNEFHASYFGEINAEINGRFYEYTGKISDLINSPNEIKKLSQENRYLRSQLLIKKEEKLPTDTIAHFNNLDSLSSYQIISSKVISNSTANDRNFIILDKGRKHGVEKDLGVISSNGILGVVANVSENYSIVRSVLNVEQIISAKIKKIDYLGILKWRNKNPKILSLEEIPKNFQVKKGDSVVTYSRFHRFPEDLPIGRVKKIKLNQETGYLEIDVQIFEEIARVRNAYILKNKDKKELLELENSIKKVKNE